LDDYDETDSDEDFIGFSDSETDNSQMGSDKDEETTEGKEE